MGGPDQEKLKSAIFITFPGTCKKALTYYQTCFGGSLKFQTLKQEIIDSIYTPVVSGSLIAGSIVIHGSDLVHNEGRKLGNYISIFLQCHDINQRKNLIKKLSKDPNATTDHAHNLVELTDEFEVRWILSI